MKILVINCGSSSIKYQVFDVTDTSFQMVAKGLVQKIGMDDASITHSVNGKEITMRRSMPNHAVTMKVIEETLLHPDYGVVKSLSEIQGVGHRVVHGGEAFTSSARITPEVIKAIEDRYDLAPLHNPPNVTGIEACMATLGDDIPNVAVFDTAIHQTMPPKAYLYAIPIKYYEQYGVRKYGFHGTSHGYVAKRAAEELGKPFDACKIITCHVGNGGSIAAFKNGKVIDTSMGLTPLEGIIMGTRSGDIDPAAILYLMDNLKMSTNDINVLLNRQSGMLGLCGHADLRDVHTLANSGDKWAKIALEAFAYRIIKYIGAYAAALNGVDAIVFTAGVGENDRLLRADIVSSLTYLGAKLDEQRNANNEVIITTDDSSVKVMRIPTNEELVIAQETYRVIQEAAQPR